MVRGSSSPHRRFVVRMAMLQIYMFVEFAIFVTSNSVAVSHESRIDVASRGKEGFYELQNHAIFWAFPDKGLFDTRSVSRESKAELVSTYTYPENLLFFHNQCVSIKYAFLRTRDFRNLVSSKATTSHLLNLEFSSNHTLSPSPPSLLQMPGSTVRCPTFCSPHFGARARP